MDKLSSKIKPAAETVQAMSARKDSDDQTEDNLVKQGDTTIDQDMDENGKTEGKHLTGTLLAQNYEILELIGSGGMSVVYKARHRLMKSLAAIKMLHAHLLAHQKTILRFQQEAQAVKALSHPNIVYVLDFGVTEDGQPYLIMDYLEGISLSDVIKRENKVPVERALHILRQTADALAHAHGKGIIHRDLKPSNIMLVKQDNDPDVVKIVDFGIAKLGEEGQDRQHLTQTGEVFGSPPYMSPEQCMGSKLDARSDVYSFGCVMYEMLTGLSPFKGESSMATMHKHLTDTPPPLSIAGCDANLLERLDAIVFKCLEKEPDKRYQTMKELQGDLQDLQSDETASRILTTTFLRLSRLARSARQSMRKHPVATLVLPITLVLALSGFCALSAPIQALLGPAPGSSSIFSFTYPSPPIEKLPKNFNLTCDKVEFLLNKMDSSLPSDDPQLIEKRQTAARFYMRFGYWGRAAEQLQRIYSATRGSVDANGLPLTDNVIIPLADCYVLDKQPQQAEYLYRQAIANYQHWYGSHDHCGTLLSRLARLLDEDGRQEEARQAYSLAATELDNPRATPECAQTAAALADIYVRRGDAAAAEKRAQDALSEYRRALPLYERALELWRALPESTFNEALCLNRLSELQEKMGNLGAAEKYYLQSIAKMQQELPSSSHYPGVIKSRLARLLWRQNRFVEAFLLERQALAGNAK